MTVSVRRLDGGDAAAARRLLDVDPLSNAYLRSEIRLNALRSGQWWGAVDRDHLVGAMVGGPLVVPWAPTPEGVVALAGQLARQVAPRMIVGPREQVTALQAARKPPALDPREVRDPQPLLAIGRGRLAVAGTGSLRRSTRQDLDHLVHASAAMHREEMGVDPLMLDPTGWRRRMSTLVARGWSWVWCEGDEIVFKAELSAWTPEVAQVQGVWTAPAHRGRGIGTAGMSAVGEAVLAEVPLCSLYVNHYNLAARRLYARLGFEQVGALATYFF